MDGFVLLFKGPQPTSGYPNSLPTNIEVQPSNSYSVVQLLEYIENISLFYFGIKLDFRLIHSNHKVSLTGPRQLLCCQNLT